MGNVGKTRKYVTMPYYLKKATFYIMMFKNIKDNYNE